MFNGFPILNGNYFSYQQYFALVFCFSSLYTFLLLLGCRVTIYLCRRSSNLLTPETKVFERRDLAVPWKLAAPHIALTVLLFFCCFMVWLVLTLLAFGHTVWTSRMILCFIYYALLAVGIIWAKRRKKLPSLTASTTSPCNLLDLLQRTLEYFDDSCWNLLMSCMLIASSVPFTALGISNVAFGFGCCCIAISLAMGAGCKPGNGCCWKWCFCCKRWSRCRDTNSTRNVTRNEYYEAAEGDSSFTEMATKSQENNASINGTVHDANNNNNDSTENKDNTENNNNNDNHGDRNLLLPPSVSLTKLFSKTPKSIIVGQCVAVLLSIIVVATTSGSCIAFFAPDMHGVHLGPITWSSSFTRKMLGSIPNNNCNWETEKFCHLYLTVPSSNASSSIIVTAHTKTSSTTTSSVTSFMTCPLLPTTTKCATEVTIHTATSNTIDWMPDKHRDVHSACLTQLKRDTAYGIWILTTTGSESIDLIVLKETDPDLTFKTFPMNDAPLEFIIGGDMGITKAASQVSQQAASHNPSFAVIGGDIAYANDIPSCIDVWDSWLTTYEKVMRTSLGNYSIPMITTVGNHDVGSNAGSNANALRFSSTDSTDSTRQWNTPAIPFLYAFFPHDVIQNTDVVMPMRDRKPFHLHVLGDLLNIYNLDTGHVVKYEDPEQMSLFYRTQPNNSNSATKTCSIAVYHVPIFPSGDYEWNSDKSFMIDPRKYWLPEFQRIGIHAAFEHHVHSLKTTQSMSANSTVSNSGTTYFGDGRWGITGTDDLKETESPTLVDGKPIFEGIIENHVWMIKIKNNRMHINAIGINGDLGEKWERIVEC